MKIEDYRSPNFNDRGGAKPSLIILHYTGMETAIGAVQRLAGRVTLIVVEQLIGEGLGHGDSWADGGKQTGIYLPSPHPGCMELNRMHS